MFGCGHDSIEAMVRWNFGVCPDCPRRLPASAAVAALIDRHGFGVDPGDCEGPETLSNLDPKKANKHFGRCHDMGQLGVLVCGRAIRAK